jgi:hypothetical protein
MEVLIRETGAFEPESGSDPRPEPGESMADVLARQDEINAAQHQIHALAYDLFDAIDTQSQRMTVQSISVAMLQRESQ